MRVKDRSLNKDQVEAKLRAAGVNPTAQRIAIARFLLCDAEHQTAEQIKLWADKNFPKMSMATVYNTLNALVEAGLLKELRFPHTECVIYDDNVEEHYHFLDEKSGEIFDLEPEMLDVAAKLRKKFKVKSVEVLIRGTRA